MSVLDEADRLNEYFFAVGAELDPLLPIEEQDEPDAHPLALRYRPTLLDRFPLEDNKETRIENGISDFCFPQGLKLSAEIQMPKFFCFVLTNGEGDRTYGNCLIIYEALPEEVEADVRKSIEEWELRQKLKEKEAKSDDIATKIQVKAAAAEGKVFFQDSGEAEQPVDPEGEAVQPAEKAVLTLSSPASSIFSPKCLCLLSKYPFVDSSRAWLMQLYRLSLSPTPIPMERYICNFLLEVPCPVPGKVDIQYNMLDQVITYPSPWPNEPLAWWGFSFESVLEWISPQNFILIYNCVLLEQQVLFHSTQLSLLTAALEMITACLYPLSWCHVYIPILPRQCLYIPTNSPVPFLLGFHSEAYQSIAEQLPETVTVVDLDRNQVQLAPMLRLPANGHGKSTSPTSLLLSPSSSATPHSLLPPIPERRRNKLLRTIREHANLYERRLKRYPKKSIQHLDDPFTRQASDLPSIHQPPSSTGSPTDDSSTHHGNDATFRVDWDIIRDAFLAFFVSLLKDYRKFIIYPSKEQPNPKVVFKQQEFISSHPSDCAAFLEEFCKTQAFQSFIDARAQPDPDDTDVAYFDEILDSRHSHSLLSLSTRRQPSFRRPRGSSASSADTKTVVALQPETKGLPSEPFVYEGFPLLEKKWFALPRPVNELTEYSAQGILLSSSAKIGRAKGPRQGQRRRRNHILNFKSDHVPADASTLVFSTFIIAFTPTITRSFGEQLAAVQASSNLPVRSDTAKTNDETNSTLLKEGSMGLLANVAPSLGEKSVQTLDQGSREEDALSFATTTQTESKAVEHERNTASASLVDEHHSKPKEAELSEISVQIEPSPKDEQFKEDQEIVEQSSSTSPIISPPAPMQSRRSSSSLRNRSRMRRLSEDLKEERVQAGIHKLSLAFDVLQRMKAQHADADEWIYRCLIDAASRMGNIELALKALTEMNEAGFMVDASVMSCLVASFAMNDSNSSSSTSQQASQTLALLDWNQLQRGRSREAHHPGNNGQRHSKKVHLSLRLGSTPKVFKDAFSAFKKMGTPTWHAPAAAASTSTSGHNVHSSGTENTVQPVSKASMSDVVAGPNEKESQVAAFDLQLDESALRDAELEAEKSSRPKSIHQTTAMSLNTPLIKYQVLYGEGLLNMLFPKLLLDTDSETCPDCNSRLTAQQIRAGWLADPNNYTTQCPLCSAAREAVVRHEGRASGGSHNPDGSGPGEGPPLMDRRSSCITRPASARRFVARFSVHCAAPGWEGSTGPGTPLWCEFLSPWVLRKEVQTILLNDGIDALVSPLFRETSQASATIFWNLILNFREFSLPLAFLLEQSVQQGGCSTYNNPSLNNMEAYTGPRELSAPY